MTQLPALSWQWFMYHLLYSIRYSVVPINYSLLTITYSFLRSTLIYDNRKYSVPDVTFMTQSDWKQSQMSRPIHRVTEKTRHMTQMTC